MKMCLISDYLLTRCVYARALQQVDGIEFVFDFGSFGECVKFLERSSVDAVLIDVRLGNIEYDVIKNLQKRFLNTKFIVIAEQEEILEVLALGAAYVLKDITLDEFVPVIDMILRGNLVIASRAAGMLQNLIREKLVIRQEVSNFHLTEREVEILSLVIKGESNSEIGSDLCLSRFTVKNYVSQIIEKLKVKTRTEATAKALRLGLVS